MLSRNVSRTQLAVILVAALAVLAGCSGAMSDGAETGQQSGATASSDVAYSGGDGGAGGDGGSGGGGAGGGAGGVGSYYGDDGDRVVVREADMRLRVENFSRAFHRMRAIADRNGGYLGDRSQDSEGEWDTGRITIRVPPENFASARDAVAALGHLENEDVRVLDFTSQYRDREERIRQLEQEERALERLLNRTDDIEEVERVREDLRGVRSELRELRSEQQSIRQRERLSTINVYVHEPVSRQPPTNYGSAFGFTDAFLQAFYGGLTAVKYVIVFFGYAIPVGLALLPLGAFGVGLIATWRRIRHRTEGFLARDDPRRVARPPGDTGAGPSDEGTDTTSDDGGDIDESTDDSDDSGTTADE